jgi:hypothetical protein
MRMLKLVLFWYFATVSMMLLTAPFFDLKSAIRVHRALQPSLWLSATDIVCFALAAIFAVASWNAWPTKFNAKRGQRAWILTASLLSLLISIGLPFLYLFAPRSHSFWYLEGIFAVPTILGLMGLGAFFWTKRAGGPVKRP